MEPEITQDVERLQQMIRKAAVSLAEHASTVQIFVTLHDPVTNGTVALTGGYGNHFAIRGQVGKWLDDLDMPPEEEENNFN